MYEDYDFVTVGHPAVAVELKVAGLVAYSLTRTLSVTHNHNQVYVYFILKLLRISETITINSFILTIKN